MLDDELFRLLGTGLLLALLVPAAWTDLRERRIPNRLTYAGMLLALLLRIAFGWDAVIAGFGGVAIAFLFSFPLFAIGALGAGDGKLLMALGMLMGPRQFALSLLVIAVAGGILSLAEAIRQKRFGATLRSIRFILWGWVLQVAASGNFFSSPPKPSAPSVTIPYGVAIAVGAMIGWFL